MKALLVEKPLCGLENFRMSIKALNSRVPHMTAEENLMAQEFVLDTIKWLETV